MPWTGIGAAAVMGGSSLLGGIFGSSSQSSASKRQERLAREQMALQKEFAQNSIRWKVNDARKAGLHPLAALGTSSASYSPVSTNIEPIDYSWLGDVGQNINRAIQQGKDAKERKEAQDLENKFNFVNLRKANAEADYWEAQAANERFVLQQQLFPPAPKVNDLNPLGSPGSVKAENLFTFVLDGKGKKTRLYPSEFMTSTWEDRPAGTSIAPLAEAEKLEQDAKLNGTVVLDHVWNPDAGEFVPVSSDSGKRALAYWKRVGSAPRSERAKIKYPRDGMNSLDRAFFDWIDRLF